MLLLLTAGVCLTTGARKNDDSRRLAKARHYYLKGAVSEAEGDMASAHEYFKKAYTTAPEYEDAGFAYGFSRVGLAEDTFSSTTEARKALGYMLPLIERYPEDVDAVEKYSYAGMLADTIPEILRVYGNLVRMRPGLSRLYLPLSYFHVNAGNLDSAVYAIREYERLEGASTETTVRKVSYWMAREDTLAALGEARMYAQSKPGESQPMLDRAMIYNLLGQQDSAIIILEEALKIFPDNPEMKVDIALMYAEKGDSVRFHRLVDEAFRNEKTEYEDRMEILRVYAQSLNPGGDTAESDKLFAYAATIFPDDADFFDRYGDYEAAKGDYAAALEKERRALELNPTEPSFLGRVISYSVVAGRPKEGMEVFENFKDPSIRNTYPLVMVYLGAVMAENQYDKALQWTDTLLNRSSAGLTLADTIDPMKDDSFRQMSGGEKFRLSTAYEIGGDIYAKMGKLDDAMRVYENAIAVMDSVNDSALNNYAYFLVETVKAAPGSELFEKAKRMSRMSLEQAGEDIPSNSLDTYAWILFKEGSYKEALEYQELAVENEGEEITWELLSHYGDILYMNDRKDEAVEQWKKALELAPGNTLLQKKVEQQTLIEE